MSTRFASLSFALAFTLSSLLALPVRAAPMLWSDNGHFYQAVAAPAGINWADASAAAQSMSHEGNPGQLATLTSAAENAFVFALVDDPSLWVSDDTNSRGP